MMDNDGLSTKSADQILYRYPVLLFCNVGPCFQNKGNRKAFNVLKKIF